MIITPRLHIIPCDDSLFQAIRMGNGVLAQVLGVNVPKRWTEFRDAFPPAYHRWLAHPPLRDWWTHLIIHLPDNRLIGTCGYKGEPDAGGMVEIGYEITAAYRNRGLAGEAAEGLVKHAFRSEEVTLVRAHTLPEENASVKILRGLGFSKVSGVEDPDEGWVWRWELKK